MTETIDSVCKRFCPIFHMHPREQYTPCSVPDLMRNSVFEYTEPTMTIPPKLDRITDVLFETTQPPGIQSIIFENATLKAADTKEKLAQLLGKYTTKENKVSRVYRFRMLDDNIDNSSEVQAIFSDPFTYMRKTYFSVTYVLFFPYNGTLEPHVFDQEYATFVFTCSNYKYTNDTMEATGVRAVRVFLSSHGKGKWYDWDEITKTPEGRPVFYSALEGHALYIEPMTLRRFFGLGNDETEEGGKVYDPIENVVVIAHPSSILVAPYYEKNKLYYYNGLYYDQPSCLFSTSKINFIYYDGYYKTTNTSEMWDIEPFNKFKHVFKIFLLASVAMVVLILMDNNDICVLTSYLFLIIFTIIITFLFMWIYIV